MARWVLSALLVLIAFGMIYYVLPHFFKGEAELGPDEAVAFAFDELSHANPGAAIDPYSVTNMSTTPGKTTWKILAKVIYGNNTICPSMTEVELHYPQFGFVTRNRTITENCTALGCRNIPNCLIAYPEEAVLMPLDAARNPGVQASISNYLASAGGSGNVNASATSYSSFTSATNHTYSDVWVITYSADSLNQSLKVILGRVGGVVLESFSGQ